MELVKIRIKHGWYSASHEPKSGSHVYLSENGEVIITTVTESTDMQEWMSNMGDYKYICPVTTYLRQCVVGSIERDKYNP